MGASDRRDATDASNSRTAGRDSPTADAERDYDPEIPVGSWEHLQAVFARAATAADRAVGLWLARDAKGSTVRYPEIGLADRPDSELCAHRALARAAATAYARRVKADGLPPEQMLVLVKAATSIHGLLGFGAQALTSDIVKWSIDAYFDE
jgi:hypothetical protein